MIISASTEWHPAWTSYEWWGDIGTGLLSFISAVVIGGATVAIAVRSHRLAATSARDGEARAARDDAERYRDQLIRVVEPAVSELVLYGNLVNSADRLDTVAELQARASTIARMNLVEAVARERDREVAVAITEVFVEGSRVVRFGKFVRVQVAGGMAEALADLLGRQKAHAELVADIRSTVGREKVRAGARGAQAEEAEEVP
ncbi:hypothetical protein NYQ31_16355 [Curtobacterium flaccumfaciens]|uniref:hypothetical protein n=1 Tax=Curtobacterium TaxID=2034 RepID=UPI000DA9DCD4|nr:MULTISPECIES: hypothetical protein [Curtobacterium]MCS6559972.1 hypothetical protein [Curtobacterium flaccumfaciens]WIE81732.1 hypothetical protein DEJ29_009895 [Curtobacterium sp. MCPF17_021]